MPVVIADLLPQPVEVEVGRGSLSVHGLPLDRVVALLLKHKDNIASFFQGEGIDAQAMVMKAPDLVVDIIAMGADAEGQENDIAKLPAASQVTALLAIWNLTVPDLKKFRESLLEAVATLSLNDRVSLENLVPSVKTLESTSPTP